MGELQIVKNTKIELENYSVDELVEALCEKTKNLDWTFFYQKSIDRVLFLVDHLSKVALGRDPCDSYQDNVNKLKDRIWELEYELEHTDSTQFFPESLPEAQKCEHFIKVMRKYTIDDIIKLLPE